jgi:hypothetical protein
VKLWDTLQAAEAIKPLVKGETGVVSFQKLVFGEVVQVARAQGCRCPPAMRMGGSPLPTRGRRRHHHGAALR